MTSNLNERRSPSRAARKEAGAQAGNSMFEILAALLLASILSGMALPEIQRNSVNHPNESASDAVLAGLNFARLTAINSGDEITICPSREGSSCQADQWHRHWIVFKDQNGDSQADPEEVIKTGVPEDPVATRSFGPAVTFRPNGATRMTSDAVITRCYRRSATSDNCTGITVRTAGIIEPPMRASPPEA